MKINQTKLLVQDDTEIAEKTDKGIFIPTNVVKRNSLRGKILAVGEGTPDIRIIYNVGETVLYHPQAGVKFAYEDKELRLIDVADVFLGGL